MGGYVCGIGVNSNLDALLVWNIFGILRWSFGGKFLEKQSKNSYYPKMSPPARRASILVAFAHAVLPCQWSRKLYGVPGDCSLFSFDCVPLENFVKRHIIPSFSVFFSTPSWRPKNGSISFWFIRSLNLVTPIENIAGHGNYSRFSALKDLQSQFPWRFCVT